MQQRNKPHFPALLAAMALLLLLCPTPAQAWLARVVAVADGDTITVEPVEGGERVKVRLHGVDAPELRQPHGEIARGFVNNATLFKVVDIQPAPQAKDRYGRTIAVVEIPEIGILQELLLSGGHAWVYPQYCKKNCQNWFDMESMARDAERGLWENPDATPPWQWRKNKR